MRKRRKLQARIRAVQANNPTSPAVAKLKQEVALVVYELQQNILKRLQKRKANVVATRCIAGCREAAAPRAAVPLLSAGAT